MFTKKKKIPQISTGSRSLLKEQVLNLKSAQEELLFKLQTRNSYEADTSYYPPMDFTESPSIQYTEGVFLQDLTTDEQTNLGLSIFYARIEETTESPLHEHMDRYQVVFVRKGMVYDNTTDEKYVLGETFCIQKRKEHSIKYMKGSEVLLISIPGLNILNNIPNVRTNNEISKD